MLIQSEQVKGLVDEAAQELSAVNSVLKQELALGDAPSGMEDVLEKSQVVEDKVQDAAEKLTDVNRALKAEVRERHVLEFQLAAVKEREETSRNAALHDTLTGLANRALFDDRLQHGLAQAKRQGWNLAVMFVDLDDFKQINDSHGHGAGDDVLRTIATRLTETTRVDDTVSRHGGDEFLYLLIDVRDDFDLKAIAEKILASIQLPCDIKSGDRTLRISVNASLGIAVFPNDGTTPDALIASADAAMYRAKGSQSRYAFAQQ